MRKTYICCNPCGPGPRQRRRGFTLLEFAAAAVLVVILLGCMDASMRLLQDMRRQSLQVNRVIAVLDNTVERLAAHKAWDAAVVERIVKDEFRRSELAEQPNLAPTVQPGDGCLLVRIGTANRVLAKVSLNSRRKE